MTEKLTLEMICKYYKAKIKYEGEVYSVIMVHTLNDMIAIHYKGVNASQTNTVSIPDCKLILRPLSSLTDEEKEYIEKIYIAGSKYEVIFTASKHCQDIIYSDDIDILDYLRSINIHVGDLPEGVYIYE